ncbi:50S ribosomal protein L10 [Pseudothermotoga sp. U03pept]|uniref:50S ribosomal protein L10 n=1 Tax=Pseudothermotoga sp. U03pept TaxID=3447012 RepID=UPI003F0A6D41
MITREQKQVILKKLKEEFGESSLILFVNYTGFNVATMRDIRRRIYSKYQKNAHFTVAKNTLIGRALTEVGYDSKDFEETLSGPTAVLYVRSGDPVDALKIVNSFAKEKKIEGMFKGGYLERRWFGPAQVADLANLPTRQELYAMVIGRVQAPIANLVYVLNGTLRKLVYALNAIKEKKSQ